MRNRYLAILAAVIGLFISVGTVFAHHGASNYDRTKMVTVKGTVTKFEMVNPHVLVHFDVKNAKGVVEHWTAETQSPNMLIRAGWTRTILKPGDEITVTGNPDKSGSPELRMEKIVLSNGKELKQYPY